MTYVFDIDGTICTNSHGEYEKAKPIYDRISKVNQLYDLGNTIIFQTASDRDWETYVIFL